MWLSPETVINQRFRGCKKIQGQGYKPTTFRQGLFWSTDVPFICLKGNRGNRHCWFPMIRMKSHFGNRPRPFQMFISLVKQKKFLRFQRRRRFSFLLELSSKYKRVWSSFLTGSAIGEKKNNPKFLKFFLFRLRVSQVGQRSCRTRDVIKRAWVQILPAGCWAFCSSLSFCVSIFMKGALKQVL